MAPEPDRTPATVLIPAGAAFRDAAGWVGASCHAELTLHGRITELLAAGVASVDVSALWAVRAHRAELAEAWHRRLPELRELPRPEMVVADPALAGTAAGEPGVDGPAGLVEIIDALALLEGRYSAHLSVAVGPADGPVADTLIRALALTADDLLSLSGAEPA